MTEKDYQTKKYNRSDASCDSNFDVTSDDAHDESLIMLTKPKTKLKRIIETKRQGKV